jgi:hypothetical protein
LLLFSFLRKDVRTEHCVAVLPKIYADCIDGQADANRRITDALGAKDAECCYDIILA